MTYFLSQLHSDQIQFVPPDLSGSHILKCLTVSDAKGQ